MRDETVRPSAATSFGSFDERQTERSAAVTRDRMAKALLAAGYSRERVEQYLDQGYGR
ncbi:hypothetical protein ACFOMD_00805 [Sphingoaurantiacus capsulatus]|uniref:Regulatory protein RecX n=1 Tax=Sphingoaurantiacus capsulatus TaxID=1771310 RepID=A0ABV7X7B3_9SPHN